MKSPREYYPPAYLAEVLAEEKRTKQAAMKRQQRRRAGQISVQRLPSGCLLYQLQAQSVTEVLRDYIR
ncbi:MAG TPA: hypothetical protein VK608_02815 [Edaphobacter sp.]|nr:hypothetical protein [Edaphobacter sp.]